MRHFQIGISRGELLDSSYRVTRSSGAYSFFHCEYDDLPTDLEGNLLLPTEKVREPRIVRFFQEKIFRENRAIVVKANSPGQLYFRSEYSYQMPEDSQHNLIVPVEDYPSGKTR